MARRALVVFTLVVAGLLVQLFSAVRHGLFMGDFRAFYCGAFAALHGQNPYLAQPLYACESAVVPQIFYHPAGGVVIPAPLPPYALALFVPLSLLPFSLAAVLWIAVLLTACAICARAVAELARLERADAWALLAFALVGMSLPYGELVPIVLAALCSAALALERGAIRSTVACCVLAALEPNIALPTLCALFLWRPASRTWLLLAGAGLAALSGLLLGIPVSVSYLSHVLPAHALAELPRETQFSLSWVLSSLGVGDTLALRLGALSYVAMLVAGVAGARALEGHWQRPAVLVLLPAAAVLLGGTFIHIAQMALALPFVALALAHTKHGRWKMQLALLLLALPFQFVASQPLALLLVAALCGWLVWRFVRADVRFALRCALGIVAYDAAVMFALVAWHAPAIPEPPTPAIDPALPQASWAALIRAHGTGTTAAWLFKLPTWAALLTAAYGASCSRRQEPIADQQVPGCS